jgi:hypothetical protein
MRIPVAPAMKDKSRQGVRRIPLTLKLRINCDKKKGLGYKIVFERSSQGHD